MKITVIIPSRNRPLRLMDTITTAKELESGKHQVTYVVGCDDDDEKTDAACQLLQSGGSVAYGKFRRTTLGKMVNELALAAPADVYCSLCDDIRITTAYWDEKIAEAVEAKPDGVFWWKTSEDRPASYAIVTEKWRAAAGYIFTDYFPFWFDDLWLLELWILAANSGPAEQPADSTAWLYVDASLEDRPYNTQRMRDLAFWHGFYQEMRPTRVAEAKRIAAALGWNVVPEIIDRLAAQIGPNAAFVADMHNIEARQGDKNEPTPEYLQAKARAAAMLQKEAA